MAYKKLKLWFDEALGLSIAQKIKKVKPDFSEDVFLSQIVPQIDKLELKDRVEVFADACWMSLGENYSRGISVLRQILGPENEAETGMFLEYYWIMPIAKYVEKYGLNHFDLSMAMIEEITKRNTGEYAIRPFLVHFTDSTLSQMLSWSQSPNRHVRRLSSEGVRPRLPWAKKMDLFIRDPTPIHPILDNLINDPSRYVQKSVANCLNDILKDNPTLGKDWIRNWMQPSRSPEKQWIIKHALRNLKKVNDPFAVSVIGELYLSNKGND